MKTNFFSLPNSFNSLLRNIVSMVLLCLLLQVPAEMSACNIGRQANCLGFEGADVTGSYYATVKLAAAASSTATLIVDPQFAGLPGFENASLTASLSSNRVWLNVALTGFSGETLPSNTVIGYVTIVDVAGSQYFEVVADGGVIVLEMSDL